MSLSSWAQLLLRAMPGSPDALEAPAGSDVDGLIVFPDLGIELAVEEKGRVDPIVAHSIVGQARRTRLPLLLISRSTTSRARDVLESNGIAYVDEQGYSLIDLPGLHVRTSPSSGQVSSSKSGSRVLDPGASPSPRLAGKASLIAQAFLLESDRDWTLNAIAERAGVTPPLAYRVVSRLERLGVVAAHGRGPQKLRRISKPAALMDLWAEEAVERSQRRTPAYVLARSDFARVLSSRLAAAGYSHEVTGVAAADLRVPVLTTVLVTEIRVTAARSPEEIASATGGRVVPEGANVVFVQGADDSELRYRREIDGVWLAAYTRIYLDAARDPRRGAEQAREYRREVFGF